MADAVKGERRATAAVPTRTNAVRQTIMIRTECVTINLCVKSGREDKSLVRARKHLAIFSV